MLNIVMIQFAVHRFGIFIWILILAFFSSTVLLAQQLSNIPQPKLPQIGFTLGSKVFALEVAVAEMQIMVGLMGRTSMEDHEGMIFIFPDQRARGFRMNSCLFDLDALFVNSKGTIVAIQEMKASLDGKSSVLYIAPNTTRYVIEVKRGVAQSLGLYQGMQLSLPETIRDFALLKRAD